MITRHYISIGDRQIHYRRTGQGPALVLLHASPVSSRIFEPMMRFMARHFTCFAFDTPSNGLSDSLKAEDPDMANYADAQAEALRALGIQKCIAYGRHTGASIAVELANRHPELVTLAMTDGYPVFTKEQSEAYLSGYLNDLPVEADGSHLQWTWNRYRDQFVFWPWSKRQAEFRADVDMPSDAFLQNGVIALLEAGNRYKRPYSAVFKHQAMDCLNHVEVPVCIASRPGDSLFSRFNNFPEDIWREEIPREFQEACARERDIMLGYKPKMDAPALIDDRDVAKTYVNIGAEQLSIWRGGQGGVPLIVLGECPGSVMAHLSSLTVLAQTRRVIAIDPAGCGESDAAADGDVSVERQVDRIDAALEALSITGFDLLGIGAGAALTLEAARRAPSTVKSMRWVDPLLVNHALRLALRNGYRDLRVENDGSHLTKLWMQERDSTIWFPWFDRRRESARTGENLSFDVGALQNRVEVLNKHIASYGALGRAVWDYPLAKRAAAFMPSFAGNFEIFTTPNGHVPKRYLTDIDGLPAAKAVESIEESFI